MLDNFRRYRKIFEANEDDSMITLLEDELLDYLADFDNEINEIDISIVDNNVEIIIINERGSVVKLLFRKQYNTHFDIINNSIEDYVSTLNTTAVDWINMCNIILKQDVRNKITKICREIVDEL